MSVRYALACVVCVAAMATTSSGQDRNEPRLPAAVQNPSGTEELIRGARQLANQGKHLESAEVWIQAAAAEPAIAEFARREAVRSLLAGGDLARALSVLGELSGPRPAELLVQAADAARDKGIHEQAVTLYRRARQNAGASSVADQAGLGLAAVLEQSGNTGEALETYRELQLTFRRAATYDLATAAVRRLATGDDRLSESDYELISDRLAGVAAFRRSVEVLDGWRAAYPDSSKLDDIESKAVERLYAERANKEARARAEAFLKAKPGSSTAATAAITLFRLEVREGNTAEVVNRGTAIIDGKVAGTDLGDRQGAARLLAEYLVSVGAPDRAQTVYVHLYEISKGRGERIDVLWRMAVASIRADDRGRATKELKQLLALKPDSETERAALYWLGHLQDATGSGSAATSTWASLVGRYPYSYYGVRAASRLKNPPAQTPLMFPELTLDAKVLGHADYSAAALLSRAGLPVEAAVFARRLSGAFKRDDAAALLAARASEAAGDYTSSSTIMSAHFGEYLERSGTGLPEDFWALAYPRAYWGEVSAAAARHDVDPLLMLGLARQESHFNPSARSPVGAIGLFQVMPTTAAELDPAFKAPGGADRLTESSVSAELAASLLAQLQAHYGGALAPAIASYNADKQRVQVWWDSSKGVPEELFIDSIPYRETRSYVRQVLANYAMYRRFVAQSASPRK